jgi:hypothetical protein
MSPMALAGIGTHFALGDEPNGRLEADVRFEDPRILIYDRRALLADPPINDADCCHICFRSAARCLLRQQQA